MAAHKHMKKMHTPLPPEGLSKAQIKKIHAQTVREKGNEHIARENKHRAAAAVPLPGSLREAFSDFPKTVCGFKLLPVVASHISILQQIDSPLLKVFAIQSGHYTAKQKEAALKKLSASRKSALEDSAEVLFVFSNAPAALREVMSRGRAHFLKTALANTLDKMPPSVDWDALSMDLAQHFFLSFATALEHEAASNGEGGEMSFPAGPATTASAGS